MMKRFHFSLILSCSLALTSSLQATFALFDDVLEERPALEEPIICPLLAESPTPEEKNQIMQSEEALDVSEAIQVTSARKNKKSVSFHHEMEVASFRNPREVVKKMSRHDTGAQYVTPLIHEERTPYTWILERPLPKKLGSKPIQKRKKAPIRLTAEGIEYRAESSIQRAQDAIDLGIKTVPIMDRNGVMKDVMIENDIASLYSLAARMYQALPSARWIEALENPYEFPDYEALADIEAESKIQFINCLRQVRGARFTILSETNDIDEFHASAERYLKSLRPLANEGLWDEAYACIRAFDYIVPSRMANLHAQDQSEIIRRDIIDQKQKNEQMLSRAKAELERVKQFKHQRSSRTIAIKKHLNDQIRYHEDELKYLRRYINYNFDPETLHQPLYLCEKIHGCPECLWVLDAVREWKQIVIDNPTLFSPISDEDDYHVEGSDPESEEHSRDGSFDQYRLSDYEESGDN